jgi:EAL domain-containing protein (putative c-di-GMP-specific phosphodiesterase class I)
VTLMIYEPEMPTQTRIDDLMPGWFVERFSTAGSMLELMFQPLVDMEHRQIIGAEALLRWYTDDGGFVNNGDWIPAAEKAQLMGCVDQWVMETVLRAAAEIQVRQSGFTLSINVSPDNLTPQMASDAAQHARELEIATSSVIFEITETTAASTPDLVQRVLHDLRGHGFGVHLDDFGTGASTLTHLHLPVTGIKLDRSLTAHIHMPKSRVISGALLTMAEGMGLTCVAEGVETELEEKSLLDLGYTVAQGWLYGRAEPIGDLLERIGPNGRGLDEAAA